jgi:hypothetical protein
VLAAILPSWLWTITTVAASIVTLALIAVLLAHILITAMPFPWSAKAPLKSIDQGVGVASAASCNGGGGRRSGEAALRRRLARAAVPLLACFVIVVLVRFGIILAERPGP